MRESPFDNGFLNSCPQRLKPHLFATFTARLKPCPDVNLKLRQTLLDGERDAGGGDATIRGVCAGHSDGAGSAGRSGVGTAGTHAATTDADECHGKREDNKDRAMAALLYPQTE